MSLSAIPHRDIVILLLFALAAAFIVLALGWPYLNRNTADTRLRRVIHGQTLANARETSKPSEQALRQIVRREPRKLFLGIVQRFDLTQQAEDGRTVRLLQRAGYRGRSPVITYLALRILFPLAMLVFSVVYLFVLVQPELSALVLAGITIATTGAGYYIPTVFLNNRIAKRKTEIQRAWPNALDLLLICVESGMSSEASFRKVTLEMHNDSPALAAELSLTTAELAYLPDRRTAFENLAKRTDIPSVKSAMVGLIQSEKHGTSLGQALRVLSRESREARMAEAEQKAAALPPKLTVPMIVFFLPVLFAVILAPMIIQMMQS